MPSATASKELLHRLGAGESIDRVCQSVGWSRAEFDAWWLREAASRAPLCEGQVVAAVQANVTIERDRWGIPHIFADRQDDLWFGFGFAMAQDRLFQMDYLRRKGLGRLAEVLGPEGVPLDLVARTVGLNRIARAELEGLPEETRAFLDAFSAGVNAWIEQTVGVPLSGGEAPSGPGKSSRASPPEGGTPTRLPIEFDLLDYVPEPWSPLDSLAIENEFRWYLTGRFPVIVMPELAKRVLGEGPLYRDFLLGEMDEEPIVPPEAYAELKRQLAGDPWASLASRPLEEVGAATGEAEGTGSNNWVVAGRHCHSGRPMLASDPHIAFEAVSCWYEAHLCGGGFNVAGMAYVGMPAILVGRNRRVAWGVTNNICSQRDLYRERTDPAHPGCFLYDGRWEPAREQIEVISVKGAEPVTRNVRFSRNGPIVDEILPPPADQVGRTSDRVSLKWLGACHGGWSTALLAMDRAGSVGEFREALRPWHVPTFNLVIADVEGHIAVQTSGRIPLRRIPERGYRPGWDPEHQWLGLLPFENMPHAVDPPRGWLASANNRLAGNDYPYPLYGTWISGYRALRIRQMIESRIATHAAGNKRGFQIDDFNHMHHDTVSLRATTCLPALVAALSPAADPQTQTALRYLETWDGRAETDLVAPALFNVFFTFWSKVVADVRFEGVTAELLSKQAEGMASRLLAGDPLGWFPAAEREPALRRTFAQTLTYLAGRFGPNMADWQWGRLHTLPLKHVLSACGDLDQLLNHGGGPAKGDMITVCNTGGGPDWVANSGAGYRLIADLSSDGLWAIDLQSQSGHPATPHYSDQLAGWTTGVYHYLPLEWEAVSKIAVERLVLCPQ